MILSFWILVVLRWQSTHPKRPWVFNALHPHVTRPRGSPCPPTLPLLLRKPFLTLLHRFKSFCPRIFWKIFFFLKNTKHKENHTSFFFFSSHRSPFSALWHLLLPQQWLQFRPPILHHHPLQQVINLLYTPVIQKHLCTYVYRYIRVLSIW